MASSFSRERIYCQSYSLVFGLLGIGLVPGLVKPFENTFELSHTQMGTVLAAAAFCSSVAAVLFGTLADRYGSPRVLATGMAVSALAALGLSGAPGLWLATAALLVFHAGNGSYGVINSFTFTLYGDRQTQGLNLLHALQGVGRLLAPLLIALTIGMTGDWHPVLVASFAVHALFIFLFHAAAEPARHEPQKRPSVGARFGLLAHGHVLLGMAAFVLLSGCELTIITWLSAFLEAEGGLSQEKALGCLTLMMTGYAAIRFLIGFVRINVGAAFVVACALGNVVGYSLLVSTRQPPLLYSACVIWGLSFGCFWPSTASLLLQKLPGGKGLLAGLFSFSSTVGAVVFMSLAGWLADLYSLRSALVISPVSAVLFVAIYVFFCVSGRRAEPDAEAG